MRIINTIKKWIRKQIKDFRGFDTKFKILYSIFIALTIIIYVLILVLV